MKGNLIHIFVWICMASFGCSCTQIEPIPTLNNSQYLEIPDGFPDIDFPLDNAFTNERWELGKKLFNDPILSIDSSISCATCHKPQFAFSDNQPTSNGVFDRKGTRNSPSLANLAYAPYFIREGSVPTLEMQVLVPIQEHNEFNSNIVDLSKRLQNIPAYVELAKIGYDRAPDPFVITRAIATFERSLISGNSAYDQYLNGNTNALTQMEQEGLALFNGPKANCISCHGGLFFTDYSFQNNGLYEIYADSGRMRFTGLASDRGLFKVPSLRNVGITAPYMFNGSISTLEEVIEHYNSGGKNHPNKSPFIVPLSLTAAEKASLVAFLRSLTDYEFIHNPNWK